jgi:hypothetical protein
MIAQHRSTVAHRSSFAGATAAERWSILYRLTFAIGCSCFPRGSVRQLMRDMSRLRQYHSPRPRAGAVSLGRVMAIWSGT